MGASEYCKVLIVDDEPLIRQGIKHFMNWEQEGFHIVGEASNGQEALERIEELRPHIVLTDIVMPVMDGEELVKRIKRQYPEIEVVVLSSFGQFDYVRSTFQSGVADYILKPKLDIQHLLAVLKMTADKIPGLRGYGAASGRQPSAGRLLERLLSGYASDASPEELRAVFPHAAFRLAGAALLGRGGGAELTRLLAEQLRSELPDAALVELPPESRAAALLVNADRDSLERLNLWARSAAAKLQAGGHPLPVLLGGTFEEVQSLGGMYREAFLRLANYAYFMPDKPVLADSLLPEPAPEPETFPLNRFTEEFKRGRFREALDGLRAHAAKLAACYTTSVFEFKSFLGNLIFNATVLLGNMGYDVKELDAAKYGYFKSVEDSGAAKEALDILDAFIAEAERCIADKEKQAGTGGANMQKLLDYIHEHYAEPLSLGEMAKHFHFNPSYLSSYFSSHNEEGFVEYLHKVRTEKAEELLRRGDAPISEISGMVGYSDHSYFCKVFKKQTGLSPSRYRREYRNEGTGR